MNNAGLNYDEKAHNPNQRWRDEIVQPCDGNATGEGRPRAISELPYFRKFMFTDESLYIWMRTPNGICSVE